MSGALPRRAIVTGAASGIGRATVMRLLGEGVRVLAVDIDRSRLSDMASQNCQTLVADLSDPRARAELADAAEDANYLVHSHGVLVAKSILDITQQDWRRIQMVNAESIFFLCQQIGPRLRPGGAIVNLFHRWPRDLVTFLIW